MKIRRSEMEDGRWRKPQPHLRSPNSPSSRIQMAGAAARPAARTASDVRRSGRAAAPARIPAGRAVCLPHVADERHRRIAGAGKNRGAAGARSWPPDWKSVIARGWGRWTCGCRRAARAAEKVVREAEAMVRKIFGAQIYGFDDETIEAVVVRLLTERKKTLALAESCTGGCLAHRVTNVPGASAVFLGGW